MIDTSTIKKMTAHIMRRERGARDRQLVHPVREWVTGLIIVSLGVVVGGGVSFYMYETTRNVEVAAETISIPTVMYQTSIVQAANAKYEKRRDAYNALIGRAPVSKEVVEVVPVVSTTTATNSRDVLPSSVATATPSTVSPAGPVTAQ